ncbi:MAG: ComF family protein [Candidatus Levyibacteriota bacterium]
MNGAFSFKKTAQMKQKTALLVDDLLTTGTTFLEAAKVLKRNRFQNVYLLCLQRTSNEQV